MTRLLAAHVGAERHRGSRASWLRAAVLGANDGLISTASLIVGVAAADNTRSAILIAGIAGLTAGALSMAAGEYVSVSSQLDTERADLTREQRELVDAPDAELEELTDIYQRRGLDRDLAERVARELSAQDRLTVHARDELGIDVTALARPVQASVVSALSFTSGALLPVLIVALAPASARMAVTIVATLFGLVLLGGVGAQLGGAPRGRAAVRVFVGGSLALLIALGIGRVTGAVVG
jgi:VIT1/CCC1 family predicted Fe2+/Mn2+ transporter